MTANIGDSLSLLAEVAGVPLHGLDDDQLDIVALRLVVESGDLLVDSFGRIVDEVRRTQQVRDRRAERARAARQRLIESHTPDDARTGLYLVPCRPEIPLPAEDFDHGTPVVPV